MAFINIENSAISIQLGVEESVTVPEGEVWKVIAAITTSTSSTASGSLQINNTKVISTATRLSSQANPGIKNAEVSFFVVGGDEIKTVGEDTTGNISGFVVKQE